MFVWEVQSSEQGHRDTSLYYPEQLQNEMEEFSKILLDINRQ